MKKFIMHVIMTLIMVGTFIGCNTEKTIKNTINTDSIMVDSIDTVNVDSIYNNIVVFSK